MKASFIASLILFLAINEWAIAADWSEPVVVRRRAEPVVTYRAKLAGDVLVVEAAHAEGWHTYAMDNVERARVKTGKEVPETELPTRIAIEGSLAIDGLWRQSPPEDLSQSAIQWYTWGFSRTGYFAVQVRKIGSEAAIITIDAQACNATSCQMVNSVAITLSTIDDSAGLPEGYEDLIEVSAASLEPEQK